MDDIESLPVPPGGESEMDAVARFAAHCAHDFNNLLTGILGNLELMQARAKRRGVDAFDGYIEGARHSAGRAAAFSQRLLVFSGRATADAEPVPVDPLVSDLADLQRGEGVPVATELGAPGAAFCDPAQLEVALLELLENAAAAGGTVTIRTGLAGGQVMIAVIDTGAGMSEAVASRAAEPFFTTGSNGAGKGLGLNIAAHFARHAGGAMKVETAPGRGTTVTLTLPRCP